VDAEKEEEVPVANVMMGFGASADTSAEVGIEVEIDGAADSEVDIEAAIGVDTEVEGGDAFEGSTVEEWGVEVLPGAEVELDAELELAPDLEFGAGNDDEDRDDAAADVGEGDVWLDCC
jgi:hypothetical protein